MNLLKFRNLCRVHAPAPPHISTPLPQSSPAPLRRTARSGGLGREHWQLGGTGAGSREQDRGRGRTCADADVDLTGVVLGDGEEEQRRVLEPAAAADGASASTAASAAAAKAAGASSRQQRELQ
eukprot:3062892-Rhodomonas_salina.2